MNIKTKIKQYLDANVHDGEDRKDCHCDKAVFTPDELQELVEEACEYALKEKKEQAKSYENLGKVAGHYVATDSTIVKGRGKALENNKNIWATKEQAEANKAMAQLSQLMQAANDGWVPDWKRGSYEVIYFLKEEIIISLTTVRTFLVFKTEKIRDKFLELHRDLITTARPLL